MDYYILLLFLMSTMVINNHLLMVCLGLVLYEFIKDLINYSISKYKECKENENINNESKED